MFRGRFAGQFFHDTPHVLCLFRDTHDKIHTIEMSDDDLGLLQHLEDGPQADKKFLEKKNEAHFEKFKKNGLILDLLSV